MDPSWVYSLHMKGCGVQTLPFIIHGSSGALDMAALREITTSMAISGQQLPWCNGKSHYNRGDLLQNTHNTHPIACPCSIFSVWIKHWEENCSYNCILKINLLGPQLPQQSMLSGVNINTIFPRTWITIMKLAQSQDCPIFIMGIPMLVTWHLYTEMALRGLFY